MPLTRSLAPRAVFAIRLAAVLVAGSLAAFLAYTLIGLEPGRADTILRYGAYLVPLMGATAVLLARGLLVSRERLAWLLLGVGLAVWVAGDVYYTAALQDLDEVPFPSLADLFYLLCYPLWYGGLLVLVRARVERFHASLSLDGLIGALAVTGIGAAAILPPILAASSGPFSAVATSLAYPLADLVLVALVVGMFALTGWRPGRSWLLIGGSLAVLAVADGLYVYLVATEAYEENSPVDALWPLGAALLALAAWQEPTDPRPVRLEGWGVFAVPLLSVLAALSLMVVDHWRSVGDLAFVLAVASVVAAMGRTALTFGEVSTLAETRRLALTDELTGLANRRRFFARLRGMVEDGPGERPPTALLVIDLDRFKELNDTLGHVAGDELLRQIGPRLRHAVDDLDTLGRLGGDEFALLMCPGTDAIAAVRAASQVQAALEEAFDIGEVNVHVEASVGVAAFPEHGRSADALLRHADVAMYQAKAAHTGYEIYAAERDRHTLERLGMLGELRAAITREELEVHYQPKADLSTGKVTGVEALVRWRHPARGLLAPAEFVPSAEQTALMRPLTLYVLAAALRQQRLWSEAGLELTVAVNLAAPNLLDTRLPDDVRRLLDEASVPASVLQLEITETSIMADPMRAGEVLRRLAEAGVVLSLDDFGTGHSSLAQLKRLPVEELKIDRSFVMTMHADREDAAIVQSTTELARRLGIRVVAEGVETAETWDRLAGWGCEEAQGFLLSRPVPADQLTEWLVRREGGASGAPAHPGARHLG